MQRFSFLIFIIAFSVVTCTPGKKGIWNTNNSTRCYRVKPINQDGHLKSYADEILNHIKQYYKVDKSDIPADDSLKYIGKIQINRNGDLIYHSFIEESGIFPFDQNARDTIRKSIPFPGYSKEIPDECLELMLSFYVNNEIKID